jgi:hypothetical protein
MGQWIIRQFGVAIHLQKKNNSNFIQIKFIMKKMVSITDFFQSTKLKLKRKLPLGKVKQKA